MPPKKKLARKMKVKQAARRLNVALAAKLRSRRMTRRVARPYELTAKIASQPVAASRKGFASYYNKQTRGSTTIIKGMGLMGPITTSNTGTIGSTLITFKINPTLLDERLRRDASTYDKYFFSDVKVHYNNATSTSTTGEAVGYFEMDPVDNPPQNEAGIKAAYSHFDSAKPMAFYHNMTWVMPKSDKKDFYIEPSDLTASDQRLTEQATFNLRLSATTNTTGVVGNCWLEYTCQLKKPTLQQGFVGTNDVYYNSPTTTTTTVDANLTAALYSGDLISQSNAGLSVVTITPGTFGALSAFIVPVGVWSFTARVSAVYLPSVGNEGYVWYYTSSANPTPIGTDSSFGVTNCGAGTIVSTSSTGTSGTNAAYLSFSARITIPNDGNTYYVFPRHSTQTAFGNITLTGGGTALVVNGSYVLISASTVFPDLLEAPSIVALTKTTALAKLHMRLLALEESKESKEAPQVDASPSLAAASASATPTSLDCDFDVYVPPPQPTRKVEKKVSHK